MSYITNSYINEITCNYAIQIILGNINKVITYEFFIVLYPNLLTKLLHE